ncbi:MAG: hypothetical protein RLZZ276_4206 [Pseudomonadota bacterium]|jgi:uncharacterized protein (DUF983 family)
MAAVPPLRAGARCRCPRRGEGLPLAILLLGALAVTAALAVEAKLSPPLWIHAVLWPIFTLGGAVAMRPPEAPLIALQFLHRDP